MWSKYAPYVPNESSGKRKWLYQEPESELILQVKKINNTRATNRQKGKKRGIVKGTASGRSNEENRIKYLSETNPKKRGRPLGSGNQKKSLSEAVGLPGISRCFITDFKQVVMPNTSVRYVEAVC